MHKTTECLGQHYSLHNSQHGKEKVEEQNERNYRAIFREKTAQMLEQQRRRCLHERI